MSLENCLKPLQSNGIVIQNVQNLTIQLSNDANNRGYRNRYKNSTTDAAQYKCMLRFILKLRRNRDHDSQQFCNNIHSLAKMESSEEEKKDDFITDVKYGPLNTALVYLISPCLTDLSFDQIDAAKQCKKLNGEDINIGLNMTQSIYIDVMIEMYNEIIEKIELASNDSYDSNGINKLTMEVFGASVLRTITTVLDPNLEYDNINTYVCANMIFIFMKYLINNDEDLEEYILSHGVIDETKLARKIVNDIYQKYELKKDDDESKWRLFEYLLKKWITNYLIWEVIEATPKYVILKTKIGFKLTIRKENKEIYNVAMNDKIQQWKLDEIKIKYKINKKQLDILRLDVSPIINKAKSNYKSPGLSKIPKSKYNTKHKKATTPQIPPSVSETNDNNDQNNNINNNNIAVPTNGAEDNENTNLIKEPNKDQFQSNMNDINDNEKKQCISVTPKDVIDALKENDNETHIMNEQHNQSEIDDSSQSNMNEIHNNAIDSDNNKNKIETKAKNNGNVNDTKEDDNNDCEQNEHDDTCDDNMNEINVNENELSQRVTKGNNDNSKGVIDSKKEENNDNMKDQKDYKSNEEFVLDPSIETCLKEFCDESEHDINIDGIINCFRMNHINTEWINNNNKKQFALLLKESNLCVGRGISDRILKKLKNHINVTDITDDMKLIEREQVNQLNIENENLKKEIVRWKEKCTDLNHKIQRNSWDNNNKNTVQIINNAEPINDIKNELNNTDVNDSKSMDTKEEKSENLQTQKKIKVPWKLMKNLMKRKYILGKFENNILDLRYHFIQITTQKEIGKTFNNGHLGIFDTNIKNNENKLMYIEIINNVMNDLLSAEELEQKYIKYDITRNKLPNGFNQIYNKNNSYDKSKIILPVKAPKQIEKVKAPTKKNDNDKVINITDSNIIARIKNAKYSINSNTSCFPALINGIKKIVLPVLINKYGNIYVYAVIDKNNKIEEFSGDAHKIEKCAKLCDLTFNVKPYGNYGRIIRLQFKKYHGIIEKGNILKAYDPSKRDYVPINYNRKQLKECIVEALKEPIAKCVAVLVYFDKDNKGKPINIRLAISRWPIYGEIISCNGSGKHKFGLIKENESDIIFTFSLCDVLVDYRDQIQTGVSVTFLGIDHPNPFNKNAIKFMAVFISIESLNAITSNMSQPCTPNINASINPSYCHTQQLYNSTNLQEQQQQIGTNTINAYTPTSNTPNVTNTPTSNLTSQNTQSLNISMGNNGWMNNYNTPNNNASNSNITNIPYRYNYTNLQQQQQMNNNHNDGNNMGKLSKNYKQNNKSNYNNSNSNGYGIENSNNENGMGYNGWKSNDICYRQNSANEQFKIKSINFTTNPPSLIISSLVNPQRQMQSEFRLISREPFKEEIKKDIKRDNNNVKVNNNNKFSQCTDKLKNHSDELKKIFKFKMERSIQNKLKKPNGTQ